MLTNEVILHTAAVIKEGDAVARVPLTANHLKAGKTLSIASTLFYITGIITISSDPPRKELIAVTSFGTSLIIPYDPDTMRFLYFVPLETENEAVKMFRVANSLLADSSLAVDVIRHALNSIATHISIVDADNEACQNSFKVFRDSVRERRKPAFNEPLIQED